MGGIGRLSDARRTMAFAFAERDSSGCFCGGAIRHSTSVDFDVLFLRYYKQATLVVAVNRYTYFGARYVCRFNGQHDGIEKVSCCLNERHCRLESADNQFVAHLLHVGFHLQQL
jgi:hypothetical protein